MYDERGSVTDGNLSKDCGLAGRRPFGVWSLWELMDATGAGVRSLESEFR